MDSGPMHVPLIDLQAQYAAISSEIRAAIEAVAEALALPMHPELSEAQQVYVVEQIANFYR